MGLAAIILVAIALAMDAFAVSLAVGAHLGKVQPRQFFRLSFHFGFFQFAMPIVGWLLGRSVREYVAAYDHWIAFGLLLFVGGSMIKESLWGSHEELEARDPTRGASLVLLSVATSIDALAVGISVALLDVSIFYVSVVIGVVAAAFTLVGLLLGGAAGRWLGRSAGVVGGLVLLGIGIKILVTHITEG